MERVDSISFILLAPGYLSKDFRVTADRGVLRIAAPDFVARPLACGVEPQGMVAEYRNGILSAIVP